MGGKRLARPPVGRPVWADLHFHELRHTFVTRKVSKGHDYKHVMAITGHKTFAVFQRYNGPTEENVRAMVLANSPKEVVG